MSSTAVSSIELLVESAPEVAPYVAEAAAVPAEEAMLEPKPDMDMGMDMDRDELPGAPPPPPPPPDERVD